MDTIPFDCVVVDPNTFKLYRLSGEIDTVLFARLLYSLSPKDRALVNYRKIDMEAEQDEVALGEMKSVLKVAPQEVIPPRRHSLWCAGRPGGPWGGRCNCGIES